MALRQTLLCKTHWNPFAVLAVGVCVGIAIIIPSFDGQGNESFLYRWQGMIGAAISSALAIGLFQWQRYCDRIKERKVYKLAATRALKRIVNHSENVKIDMAMRETQRHVNNISEQQFPGNIAREVTDTRNSILEVTMILGKYLEILASVSRDTEIAGGIVEVINEIEDSFSDITDELRRCLETGGGERNEDNVPVQISQALDLFGKVKAQRNKIENAIGIIQISHS